MKRIDDNGELLTCHSCGKSFAPMYRSCPYCQAASKAKYINKKGHLIPGYQRILGIVLAFFLAVGGGYITFSYLTSGGLNVAREYAVTSGSAPSTVQVGVTEQAVNMTGTDTAAQEAEETSPVTTEDIDPETPAGETDEPEE